MGDDHPRNTGAGIVYCDECVNGIPAKQRDGNCETPSGTQSREERPVHPSKHDAPTDSRSGTAEYFFDAPASG